MKKTFKSYVVIWTSLFILFNVVSFVSFGWDNPNKYTTSFWISYAFITISFIGQLVCTKIAFNADNYNQLFFNLPLITVSWTGLLVSFVVGSVCMFEPSIPYWVSTIVCMLFLVLNVIAITKGSMGADISSKIDEEIKDKTLFIKSLVIDAEELLNKAQTEEVKVECKKIYEAIRYSDPVSDGTLKLVEDEILLKFNSLKDSIKENEIETIKNKSSELIDLINERNKKCKLYK